MNVKLSICIPTYNRLAELKTNLNFVLPQVAASPAGSVEIVIVNNASTDGTTEFIETLPGQYPFIRVFHNSTNLGFDGNTAKCIEYAAGEYAALLSDDDFYLEGQVKNILKIIAQQPYALIRLNYHTFLEDPHIPYQTFQPEKDVLFEHATEMYDIHRFHNGGHFSGIIYRSELAKEALAKMLAAAPLTIAERSRGVYGELELRIAKTTTLPARFIGVRRLATSIPKTLSYAGLEHICLDHLRIYDAWLSHGVITPEEFQIQKDVAIARLPQMIVTFTPRMTTPDIVRVTAGLSAYLQEDPRYRLVSLPLLYIGRFRIGKGIYTLIHRIARWVKRTILYKLKVLVLR
jgi:glycosyltransferase involved in cell wall biosynthesis